MSEVALPRRLLAEGLGTAFLLMGVVGSGIMGETLAGGNVAIALLANAVATGALLTVLILMFAPLSGAHFNPAVSFAFWLRGELPGSTLLLYVAVQIGAAILGVLMAHLMFASPAVQLSETVRAGGAHGLSEIVATFGLVLTIFGVLRGGPTVVAPAVGLYITAAYWFTASTSFANPAVTIGRTLTDTFSGIRPADAPVFLAAQIAGAALAAVAAAYLWPRPRKA